MGLSVSARDRSWAGSGLTLLELLNIDFLVAIDEPLASPDEPIVSCLTDLFAWNWDWATGLAKSNTEWVEWD